jgi:CRP-like cAMP-binding protein
VTDRAGAEEVVSFGEVQAFEGGGQGGFGAFGQVGKVFYIGEEGGHGNKNKFYSMMVHDFIASIVPVSAALRERLDSILKSNVFGKKEFLLKEGQVCDKIYFVEKGLVRIYYLNEGVEICSGLLLEGGFMISVESFFRRQKSYEFIQAVEETEVLYISFDELEAVYRDFPEFNIVGRKLITEYYIRSEERNYVLRRLSAREKYKYFQGLFGANTVRIPRKDIASYLGINLETLSRLSGKI